MIRLIKGWTLRRKRAWTIYRLNAVRKDIERELNWHLKYLRDLLNQEYELEKLLEEGEKNEH
jgi:hypothetical protein